MKFPPTQEQQAAIDLASTGADTVLEAGAGCAKSTSLEMIAAANPDRTYLGIVFNKAIATENQSKASPNVSWRTGHSLAFGSVGKRYAHRLKTGRMKPMEIARILRLEKFTVERPDGTVKVLGPDRMAGIAMAAVRRFCQTADQTIGVHHVPYVDAIDLPEASGRRSYAANRRLAATIAPALTRAWADAMNENGVLPFSHDHYFKIWCLEEPVLRFDTIFVDEAQDTNPALLGVVAAQKCQRVIVGDSQQAIYEWRGAVDALQSFRELGAETATLSTSFRFGQPIADVANGILDTLGATLRLVGCPGKDGTVGSIASPTITLCRTNARAVSLALAAIADGKRVALIGGADEVVRFAEATIKLMDGQPVTHPDLACFDSWSEVLAYVEGDELGSDLKVMVNLMCDYDPEMIISELGRTVAEEKADVILSTAHRSKGRQWPSVKLAGDFPDGTKRPMTAEEWRLLYVAVTRAQESLDISAVTALRPEQPMLPETIERLQEEAIEALEASVVPGGLSAPTPELVEQFREEMSLPLAIPAIEVSTSTTTPVPSSGVTRRNPSGFEVKITCLDGSEMTFDGPTLASALNLADAAFPAWVFRWSLQSDDVMVPTVEQREDACRERISA